MRGADRPGRAGRRAAKSTINRITKQLAGQHWMLQSDGRIAMLNMCEDCRVHLQATKEAHPTAMDDRARPRGTNDGKKAHAVGLSADEFLKKGRGRRVDI